MSNHYHIVATDPLGTLPVFMHWLNEYAAKCLNSHWGRWESLWSPGSYSAVALPDAESIRERLVYTYVNPVAAGLVGDHRRWPGASSVAEGMGGPAQVIKRPDQFFRRRGPVPSEVRLRLVLPQALVGDRWLEILRDRIRSRESEIRAARAEAGRGFSGRRRVLRQAPFSTPLKAERRRGLNPRVATRDKWKRIESIQRLRYFLEQYREAWAAFVAGDRNVHFPFGTYAMRVQFGASCHDP
jgi:hypothetical protein